MNTLARSYKSAFRARPSHLRADARRWLCSLFTGAVVAYAFAWVPLSVAQSGKNIADLQFMGADAHSPIVRDLGKQGRSGRYTEPKRRGYRQPAKRPPEQ
jgi:hypothetical protein